MHGGSTLHKVLLLSSDEENGEGNQQSLDTGQELEKRDNLSTNKGTIHMRDSSRVIEEQDYIQSTDNATII